MKVEDSMERIEEPWKRELVRSMLKIYFPKFYWEVYVYCV